MLRFVLRKLAHKRWMAACLLIGNVLLVSIASCNPMYTEAVLQRMLDTRISEYTEANNRYPGVVVMTGTASRRAEEGGGNSEKFFATDQEAFALPEKLGVPALWQVRHYYVDNVRCSPDIPRSEKDTRSLSLGFLSGMEEHISLVAGRLYEPGLQEDGCWEVIISQSAMAGLDLLLDETFTADNASDTSGEPLRLRVVGVYKEAASDDLYWVRTPTSYRSEAFLAEEDFRTLFLDGNKTFQLSAYWYNVLDCASMRAVNVEDMQAVLTAAAEPFNGSNAYRYYDYIGGIFSEHIVKAAKIRVTLLVLQVPVFALLAAFIFMVSRQMLEMEQAEIAILKSRGAGRGQVIGTYLLQSAVLALTGAAVGMPLGIWLCQVLGSANAFLEFVSRKALDVRVNRQALLFAGAAVLLSVCAMTLPVLRYASVSIVAQKQNRHKSSDTPLWQKFGLDFVLLGVALYGLYSFNSQKAILAERVADGAGLDPLLFLCSSLFILGAGLVAVRVAPALAWLVYKLGSHFWGPALYASFLRVLRTRKSQGFIMVFLVMTIALGMFNSQAARTVNSNEENRLRYLGGADIVLRENWDNNAEQLSENSLESLMYDEPDLGRYTTLEGAASVTPVLMTDTGSLTYSSKTLRNITVMGIHTKQFGETVEFQEGLLPVHINLFLNRISQDTRAVLISRNLADYLGLRLGDAFNYRSELGGSVRGVVYGIVEYWPGYNPLISTLGSDGHYHNSDHYLIVAHLSQLQSVWGVTPYQVWIRAKGSTSFLYDLLEERQIQLAYFHDIDAELVALKNDPIFQGTNGILTVGFIVALLLCAVGFLMYWVLSIQSRSLQFGIFRAMGMRMWEILVMLVNEQVFISGAAIGTGALVGMLASRLYIPLIQITYAPTESVIPLSVVSDRGDLLRLFGVVGIVIVLCMGVLGVLISRIRISQALKLGED